MKKVRKGKIVGYIVYDPSAGPYHLNDDIKSDAYGILWFTGASVPKTTLFKSRKEIRDALKRTRKYGDEHKYAWPWLSVATICVVKA